MRVIAGKKGGMKLYAPSGATTRPTSDRVKEALFSIIDSAGGLCGATVLDLFAGSGALGIEALSRGAESAVFVENNKPALVALKKNLIHTGFVDKALIQTVSASLALQMLAKKKKLFSLVLLDPPYQSDFYISTIQQAGSEILSIDGILVAETATRNPLPGQIGCCIKSERRIYGDTALEFYTLEQNHAP